MSREYMFWHRSHVIAICRYCSKEIPRGGTLSKTFNITNLIRASYGEYEKLATAIKATVTNNATLTQPSNTDVLKKHKLYTPDSKKTKDILAYYGIHMH